jgi:DNA-binding transcriptional ArsR family regulator
VAPDLDRTLAALADPSRRAIVELLRQRTRRPSEVADALSLSRPALSRHLKVLRLAGLVAEELDQADARARTVRLRPEPFARLRSWVEEVESFWTDQLGAFKTYAENGSRRRRR